MSEYDDSFLNASEETEQDYSNNQPEITGEAVEVKTEPAKIKKRHSGLKTFFALVVIATLVTGLVYGGFYFKDHYGQDSKETTTAKVTSTSSKSTSDASLTMGDETTSKNSGTVTAAATETSSEDMTVEEIAANCLSSVVAITNVGVSEVQTMWGTYTQDSESAGSGVIIAQTEDELLILTNYHVVEGYETLTVVFSYDEDSEDPEAVEAQLKGCDASLDLAVIAIDTDDLTDEILENITIAVIGDSDSLVFGEQVVAIGNALGYGQSVTTGIVSALNRTLEIQASDGTVLSNQYIQTDAAINPGNSGGGLFNMNGELVGINSAKVSDSSVEGMGYAIPITDVLEEIKEMMNEETKVALSEDEQGYLCLTGETIDSETASMYNVPQGVYVASVYEGLAADNAGLKEGDIIYEINGVTVSTMDALKKQLTYLEAGSEVTISYVRYSNSSKSYKEESVTVTLSSYDDFEELSEKEKSSNESSSNGNSNDFWDFYYGN